MTAGLIAKLACTTVLLSATTASWKIAYDHKKEFDKPTYTIECLNRREYHKKEGKGFLYFSYGLSILTLATAVTLFKPKDRD